MSYFDTTVFNRIAMQQKGTNDLLRELIKTLQEQKSKCRYPTQNFEPPVPAQTYVPPVFCKPVPQPQWQWPNQNPYTLTCSAEQALDAAVDAVLRAQQPAPAGAAPECPTCSDHGAVGNILTAEPCPDCTRWNDQPAPATQQGVAYAALPAPTASIGVDDAWCEAAMRAFADATHALRASRGQAPAPPPECETEAEKRAFAFGWFKALESERMKADNKKKDPL